MMGTASRGRDSSFQNHLGCVPKDTKIKSEAKHFGSFVPLQ